MKEIRNRADESARNKQMHEQEGVQFTVPLAGQHFESLLTALGVLYTNDNHGLILDFWCPSGNFDDFWNKTHTIRIFMHRLPGQN